MLQELDQIGPVLALAIVAVLILVWDLLPRGKPLPAARGKALLAFGLLGPAVSAAWAFSLLDRNESGFAFEGSVAVDDFSLFFAFLFAGISAAVMLSAQDYGRRLRTHEAEFFALLLFATSGMVLLAMSRDLILIFVALELTSISQYIMASMLRDEKSTEAGMKYLLMGAISTAVILYGMAYLFGLTGTTRLVAPEGEISIALMVAERGEDVRAGLLMASVLLIAGLGFKMAAVPFQMWVPDVYSGAPTPVAAFLSVASKAVAFAVALRIFFEGLPAPVVSETWSLIFAIIAAISMSLGNILALVQTNIKRLLGYSSIAQAGYVMVGLAAVSAIDGDFNMGASGVLFYLAAYAFTNLAAFIAITAVSIRTGNDEISSYAGLFKRAPLLAAGLAFALVSLTGIPPAAGFIAKLYIFNAGVQADLIWLVIIAVINSVVSAFYYLRVASIMFTREPETDTPLPSSGPLKVSLVIAMAGVLVVGVLPSPLIEAARTAAAVFVP